MKSKIKFENIFVVFSSLFIFGCCCYYGNRLVKYYKIYNPKTETGETTEILAATVRNNNAVITEGDGLYIHNGDFVFKGINVNNYASYNDKIWRILWINRNGNVKLVLDEIMTEMAYDNENKNYNESLIHAYITDENNLKLNTNVLEKMTICLDVVDEESTNTCENKIEEYVSLLSIEEYANSVINDNQSYINNSLNIWLYSKNSKGLAWKITKGYLSHDTMDMEFGVKPTIMLKHTAFSTKGDGTKENPYIVKDGE